MSDVNYSDYMKSPEWNRRRLAALKRADHHCQLCGATDQVLDVHHNSYARLGRERLSDVIVLCEKCHQIFHDRLPRKPRDYLWFLTGDAKDEIRRMILVAQGKK